MHFFSTKFLNDLRESLSFGRRWMHTNREQKVYSSRILLLPQRSVQINLLSLLCSLSSAAIGLYIYKKTIQVKFARSVVRLQSSAPWNERKCGGEHFWQKKDAPLAINWRSSIINTVGWNNLAEKLAEQLRRCDTLWSGVSILLCTLNFPPHFSTPSALTDRMYTPHRYT